MRRETGCCYLDALVVERPVFRVRNSQHGLDVYRKHRPDVRFGALRMSGGTLGELLSALHYNMPEKRPDVSTLAGLTAAPHAVKHGRQSLRRDESGSAISNCRVWFGLNRRQASLGHLPLGGRVRLGCTVYGSHCGMTAITRMTPSQSVLRVSADG